MRSNRSMNGDNGALVYLPVCLSMTCLGVWLSR